MLPLLRREDLFRVPPVLVREWLPPLRFAYDDSLRILHCLGGAGEVWPMCTATDAGVGGEPDIDMMSRMCARFVDDEDANGKGC